MLPSLAPAQAPPTIDQSLEMVTVASPSISPDGTLAVFQQTRTDWDANAFENDLWLASTGPKPNPHRLTAPIKSATGAAWSPDGRWIAFLSNRPGQIPKSPENKSQIYLISPLGGEAIQLTHFETGVSSFLWAPNGKSIAFVAEDPETKAQKDRKDFFGDYHVIHADYTMSHLWLADLPADPALTHPTPVRLTEGAFTVSEPAFSPDSTRIAFVAQRDPDLISNFSADIDTVTIASHALKKIVDTPGPDEHPIWSPDGSHIAYLTSNAQKSFFFTNNRVASVPAEGGTPVILDPTFDEDAQLVAWAPAGIFFTANQKTASQLFLLDPATHTVRPISPTAHAFTQASLSPDFTHLAFRGAAPGELPEIFTASISSGALQSPTRITHAGDQLAPFPHSTKEVVQWRSGDGVLIEGILQKPANFDPTRKYPLLVVIHGGPTGVDQPFLAPDRYYPTERWLARGALILHPNYRGSAGYGEKFRSLNYRNLGVGDYADVISGVDALIVKGLADPNKVAAMGWSQGGYISAFITASSDRFQAVSVGAGISDWSTYYYNTDITPFTRQYLGATPSDDPAIYARTSPITYIAHAKTPTLIQQGGADKRVPVPDSFELRQALEDHNIPVKMVLYDGFGHPINKPKQQRAVMEENELWFNHYIWGDPLPASLTPTQPAAH
jgi:dipeptidyl aminopeptidase/acylaminoacyl peptidase